MAPAENSNAVRDISRIMSIARQAFSPAAGNNADTIATNRPAPQRQADMPILYSCARRRLPLGGNEGGQNVHYHHSAEDYAFLSETADRARREVAQGQTRPAPARGHDRLRNQGQRP